MNGGMDYGGMIQLRNQMGAMYRGYRTWLEAFLVKQALAVVSKTKENTPVDTGWLRNNWFVGDITRSGDNIEITILNEVEYASFVEYGHLTRGGGSWVDGQFMCTLAVEDIQRQIPARYSREFAVWVRRLGADTR